MGVDREDYLMWAVDVGYDNVEYDDFEEEIDQSDKKRFDLVYDGMGGQYALAGKIIAVSDPYEGIHRTEVSDKFPMTEKQQIANAVSKAMDKEFSVDEFKLLLFSHFS